MTLEATYTHPHIQEQMFQKLWEKPESQDIEVGGYSYKYSPSTSIGDRPGELKVERENYGEGKWERFAQKVISFFLFFVHQQNQQCFAACLRTEGVCADGEYPQDSTCYTAKDYRVASCYHSKLHHFIVNDKDGEQAKQKAKELHNTPIAGDINFTTKKLNHTEHLCEVTGMALDKYNAVAVELREGGTVFLSRTGVRLLLLHNKIGRCRFERSHILKATIKQVEQAEYSPQDADSYSSAKKQSMDVIKEQINPKIIRHRDIHHG